MSNEQYSLSIDLGTSSCKAALVDQNEKNIFSASSGYKTYSEAPGWAEQDPDDWIQAAGKAVGKVFNESGINPDKVKVMALTSAAHIGILADKNNKPLNRAILWSDQRSEQQASRIHNLMGVEILDITCNRIAATWTLAHFLWLKEKKPEIWKKINRVFLSKDYLLYYLTGESVTDPATAVSSMFCDSRTLKWSPKLCGLAELNLSSFPVIRDPGEIAGVLNNTGAGLLGLKPGTPVVNGSLDSAMETYGAGARKVGDFVIRIGTAGGVHTVTGEPLKNQELLTYPYLVPGLWYSQAGTNSAGSALRWALEAYGLEPAEENFHKLAMEASGVFAGSDGLFFHPYLSGERTPYWNSDLRGTFSGMTFLHTKAHFSRAMLEGVAFSICDALLSLSSTEKLPDTINLVGKAAENPVLTGIIASILNRKISTLSSVDSSYGAALFGLKAAGLSSAGGLREADDRKTYLPEPADVEIYRNAFSVYRSYAKHLVMMYDKNKTSGGHG